MKAEQDVSYSEVYVAQRVLLLVCVSRHTLVKCWTTQPRLLPCTDGQPLLPAACAIALMPRPASQHAPTALQHLMGPGSPISDVFDECAECARLRASESTTQAVRIASGAC